jgi:hypothetical protein
MEAKAILLRFWRRGKIRDFSVRGYSNPKGPLCLTQAIGCKGSPSEIFKIEIFRELSALKLLIEYMISDYIYKDITPSSYIICLYAVLLMS